ncbi:MAG: hypothetical protein J7K53_04760 [Bacteroidales bacterium]|nr:hypothetical protein [Bacteroidales bacterium]
MKRKKSFLNIFSVITGLLLLSSTGFSQINFDLFKGGVADGIKVLEGYITPYANAFGSSLNGGWYNTGKPHKLGGFDITLSVSTTLIPEDAKTFDLSELGLSTLTVSGNSIAPTIAGENSDGPLMEYWIDEFEGTSLPVPVKLASFNTPPGINWGIIPLPMIKAGIGLPLGTEIIGRFIPTMKVADGSFGLWGVGLKHSLVQYLPGSDLFPVDISLMGGYTKISVGIPVSMEPENTDNMTYELSYFENQKVNMDISAYTINLLISKKLPIVTFYGGVGYSGTSTSIAVDGNFALPSYNASSPLVPIYTNANVTTIPSFDIESFSGVRLNAGMRLTLGVLTIHADYTKANYSVITAGLGISFR